MASKCPLCRKAEENMDHLLLHCLSIWDLWEGFIHILGVAWVWFCTLKDLMDEWSFFPINKKTKKVWKVAPLCLIWEIWKERNRVVFKDMPFSYSGLKNSYVSALSSWVDILGVLEDTVVRIFFCIL